MNIEKALIEHLTGAGYTASADVPATRPQKFVTVERTGGSTDTYGIIDRPLVAVQVWADTRANAASMAEDVTEAVLSIVGSRGVSTASREGCYNFPDPDSRQARYQLTFAFSGRNY